MTPALLAITAALALALGRWIGRRERRDAPRGILIPPPRAEDRPKFVSIRGGRP